MREIIGTLSLKVINTDRDSFSDQVMMKASKDMDKLGIEILSCNIQNVTDENGLIKDLGADNTSLIKKNAAIAKAQADRDIAIAQAEADKAANEARVLSDTQIAQKNNELEIRRAELKIISDNKKAEADAAYKIQAQSQQKSIETETVNAQIARAERDAELKKQEVEIARQRLDAEIRAKADADRYREEQQAQAELFKRQKEAEAKKFEQQQDAEAKKAMAEAVRFAREQEAEGIRATGLAEAEALEKKAEAMKKYGQAAMVEMIVKALPEMAKAIAEPLSTIDKVTIIDGNGEGSGVGSMGSYVPQVLAKTMESVKEVTGIDIADIMRANTYDAKVNKNVNITGLDGIKVEAPAEATTSTDTTAE